MTDDGFKYLLRNQVTDSVYDNAIQPDYYAFYFDIKSWGERIKTFIKVRIEKQPVWFFIDDGEIVQMILVLDLEQFEQLSTEIDILLKEKEA